MLIKLVSLPGPFKHPPHVPRGRGIETEIAGEVQHAPAGDEVGGVGVVLDVADSFPGGGFLLA